MGRLDLPDPLRDEDLWLSAHELCKTRFCGTVGCDQDAQAGDTLCLDCARGESMILRLKTVMGG